MASHAAAGRSSVAVIGAGALGLGFLGPELAPECRVTYLDVPAKADLLDGLHNAGGYTFNETGLSLRPRRVEGVDALCPQRDAAAADAVLDAADLAFTCVGEPALPALAPMLAAAALRRPAGRPLRVLCSENGLEIARKLRGFVEAEAGRPLPRELLAGDTVMGRMCKVVPDAAAPLEPPVPGLDWAVVAEPFFGIPAEAHALAGLERLPAAIDAQEPARFRASEDVKMLAHNGLHAVLGCLGHLRGYAHFDDLRADAGLMDLARRLLVDEAAVALLAKHRPSALGRTEFLNYADSILRRVTCPVLHDPIARGVRGIMRKLQPWERLVYSLRTVARHGAAPKSYAAGIAAAVRIAVQAGETDLDLGGVLTMHCGLDPQADADLIALVEDARPEP